MTRDKIYKHACYNKVVNLMFPKIDSHSIIHANFKFFTKFLKFHKIPKLSKFLKNSKFSKIFKRIKFSKS